MAEGRADQARPEELDEERLGAAMSALLGGAWPGAGEAGEVPAFTLPPPRRFDSDDQALGEPPDQLLAPEAAAPGSEVAAPEVAAPEVVAPDPWASLDEPTQAHVWDPTDDAGPSPEPAPVEEPAPLAAVADDDWWSADRDAGATVVPPAADDWWSADHDTGATVVPPAADVENRAPSEPVSAAGDDPWKNEPLQPVGSTSEPEDQAALAQAGLAGPMNAALSNLRRLGDAEPDATQLTVPAAGGGSYAGSDKMADLRDWWSGRGRELLPGLAVAAVVVLAFAVVLLGRNPGSDESNVNTGRVIAPTTVPTSVPDEFSTATEPPLDEPLGEPAFSEPPPPLGIAPPTTKKPAATVAPRRPSSGAPAGGRNPSSPKSPSPTAPPASPDPTQPPATTPPTTPDTTTPTTEPSSEERADRCALLPLDRLDACLRGGPG